MRLIPGNPDAHLVHGYASVFKTVVFRFNVRGPHLQECLVKPDGPIKDNSVLDAVDQHEGLVYPIFCCIVRVSVNL